MNRIGSTTDDRPVLAGIFQYAGTHGVPLEMILHYLRDRGLVVCWISYIEDARADGAKDRTIRSRIQAASEDVFGMKYSTELMNRVDRYMRLV